MIMITVAMLLGLILCLLLGVPYVDIVKKKMFNQHVKDVVAEQHKAKDGTPTTGGIFIFAAIVIASVTTLMLAQKLTTTALIVLITLFFYALIGFQDDYIKIKNKENDGISARGKFLRQVLIALLPAIFVMYLKGDASTYLNFGFWHFNIGWLYPVFVVFVLTGASNAVNLTDGLDGLAASCGVFAFLACTFIAYYMGEHEVSIISATVVGALIGFLKYNKPKAQIFMGDTGSLALGGLLGTLAVIGKFELWLIPIGIVFICETLSVMLQVLSFKTTGKRIFKMSPIHHHFELCGWSEKRIVVTFALVSAIFSIIAIIFSYLFFRGLI
ncbi:phospho-N-acetylmuramoyl-pentapeptide-transferase [bacterium]|nr:phospho-N-acetylmuramoyl-pentapeptide-transferase [bacterium]